jgi:hypothetical protein
MPVRTKGLDRGLAWLVTGPVGRVSAFLIDFGAALLRGLRSRFL